jgi:L-fuconolactonase
VRSAPAGPPETWASNPDTARGLNELARRDLGLDVLVTYEAFEAVSQLAAKHPSLRIILDHCGGPPLREGQLDAWRAHLAPLAGQPNIYMKYSSLLLYAEPDISVERIQPVAEALMQAFGPQRLLWGSNWPVELMGGTYEQSFNTMHAALQPLTTTAERQAIYGGNAASFYRVR